MPQLKDSYLLAITSYRENHNCALTDNLETSVKPSFIIADRAPSLVLATGGVVPMLGIKRVL